MRKTLYSFIAAIFIVSVTSFVSFAATIPEGSGTEEAAFLKIDAATRPVAMGGAYVSVANDVSSVFWNPAGLTQIEQKEFSAMFNRWLTNIKYGSGAYSQRIGKNAAVGISTQWLYSEIEKRTSDTIEPDGYFKAYSYSAGITGSYALVPKFFSVGGTVKYIGQDFDLDESNNGVAVDLGGLISVSGLGLGASVQNLKIQMSNEGSLPTIVRVGASYNFDKYSLVSAELTKSGKSDASYHLGLEKWLRGIFAVRVGYCIGNGNNPKDGLSAGLGLKAYGTKPLEKMNFQIDYAYVPASDWEAMGNTHRISMLVRF